MREEVANFLTNELRLTLSMEKTAITHLNDGFDFLGFTLQRCMGHNGMKTKVFISKKGMVKHLNILRAATAPNTHEDSVEAKLRALSRIIAGWCRYYQYTSIASRQFNRLAHKAYWLVAHWLGRKHKLKMTSVLSRFSKASTFAIADTTMTLHSDFHTKRYYKLYKKPNPYLFQAKLEREELPDETPWTGFEERPGWIDTRRLVMERDKWTCRLCKASVTPETGEVDHLRPYHLFKRPVNANHPDNLWTLCLECHRKKTERENAQRMESRMR
jgi:hypothetical protein